MGLFAHSHRRLFVAQSRFIRTSCTQSIVDIYDLQNSRQQRDFALPQTVRIAASIRMFVMITNNRQHETQRFQWSANILTCDWMLLHHSPFFRTEVRSLFENLIRHSNFPEIMQVAASSQRNDRLLVQAEVSTQGARM